MKGFIEVHCDKLPILINKTAYRECRIMCIVEITMNAASS